MCCIIKVFNEAVCLAIVSEGRFVLLVSCGKSSTSLSDVRLVAIGTDEF
jgi:hypothetical protein